MAAITRTEAIVQIQEVLKAYENKIRDIRFNTENLSPEGKNIVDSYCSNEKNEQVLVKKAYSKKKFFKKVNETQLLEFYKVCYELNKNLSLNVKELLLITAIEEDKESFWESFWGALQGEFNEDPSGLSIMLDMGLNFIPFVGQVLDARDILACLDKLIRQKRTHEIMIWVTLVLTAIGCVPYAGDVIKAIGKAIVKGADDIIITLLKKLDAEDVYKAFIKFYNKLNESLEEAIKIINQWLLEAEKRYNETDLSELIRNANEYINKAIEFIQTKIDEFAQKMFGKGNVATVVESVKKSPEEILQEAGYKKGKLIQDNVSAKNEKANTISQKYLKNLNKKSVKKITRREDGYEILKRYEEYFGDNVEFVNELIENTPGKEIYVEPEKLILNYLSTNKINVDSINIKQIINKNTNFNELKKTIDLINSNVKDIDPSLLKSVPLDTPVNKQTAYMKELNAILEKKGMTLERYKEIVLRNIDDTSNLPREGSEELKQIAETIRSIREEVIGKMNKDVEFRKYITQQDLIKYLNGEKNTITGFIARECDANILDNYNEIFNSFRLDYPNTDYNPKVDNFIAYVKFKVKEAGEIDKIEIPYSPKFGGTNTYDKAPCSGTGILNSKNGLIIPELKVKYREKIELLDGAELHIQTRDGKDILIGVFSDERFIPQGE